MAYFAVTNDYDVHIYCYEEGFANKENKLQSVIYTMRLFLCVFSFVFLKL